MLKILNGYCGIGGNRKLWENVEVTAIENNKEIAEIYKDNFPNDKVLITDAHKYLLNHYQEFDFIWYSPPCQSHSKIRRCMVYKGQNKAIYPDMSLYQEVIFLKYFAKKTTNWIVENVKPYYDPLIKPQIQLGRHYIWSNFYIRKREFKNEMPITLITGKKDRHSFNIDKYDLNHRKDQILRNLVDPEIGMYLLNESFKNKKPIFNFNY